MVVGCIPVLYNVLFSGLLSPPLSSNYLNYSLSLVSFYLLIFGHCKQWGGTTLWFKFVDRRMSFRGSLLVF